ncbi:MAG: chromosomal replication initiator protein DnaA [Bdellovibrionales bacterium]|nr:chromosomal replication initiator protein DnaA [Bdellovibrionales bacterium]
MNQTNLWASTYHNILLNHHDAGEVKFWLDSLKWGKAERLGPGRVRIVLLAPNQFYKNFIHSTFKEEIEEAVSRVLGESCEVSIDIERDGKGTDTEKTSSFQTLEINPLAPPRPLDIESLGPLKPPSPTMASPATQFIQRPSRAEGSLKLLDDRVDPNLTFDNYIVGPSNQFAYASAFSTAENPAAQFNPLFIYGQPAVGKTHLLHAIGNHIRKKNPHIRVYFISAENFVNEFIESLQHKKPGEFRAKYRESVDLLLIDDVQFIVGKDRSEEEFIHTFNTLVSMKKMIVLTSDKAPKDIDGLEERIRTRFEMGLVADIRPPEIETRIAILKAKAESDDIYLPDEVATFLGTYVKDTVRNLHGALVKLQQYASLTGSEITLDLAKQVLQSAIPEEGQEYTVEMIMSAVCKHYQIKIKDLKGISRAKNFALPRQIAMSLIRRYTNLGFREIGQIFGKDHSTAVHAHQKIESEVESDPDLKRQIESIREQL